MFPGACTTGDVVDKEKYPNVVRVYPPYNKQGRGALAIMQVWLALHFGH